MANEVNPYLGKNPYRNWFDPTNPGLACAVFPDSLGTYVPKSPFPPGEDSQTIEELPPGVDACIQALKHYGIWFRLSMNEPALSCADAASKRFRDGNTGIDIADELKSMVCKRKTANGLGVSFVALHCRASSQIDSKRIKRWVGSRSQRVEADELAEMFDGAKYGTVNPVLLARSAEQNGFPLLQVFDSALFTGAGVVMTNAGHHNFGLEVQVRNMVDRLPGPGIVDRIRQPEMSRDGEGACPQFN